MRLPKLTTKMPGAFIAKSSRSMTSGTGRVRLGRLDGISPSTEMPNDCSSKNHENTIPMTTATSGPVKIGRERKFAMNPRRSPAESRPIKPTAIANAAEATTLCCSDPLADSCDSEAARPLRVATSGPTMSWRDEPKMA